MKNIQSTTLPEDRPTFNIWANGIYSKPDPWKIKSSFTNKNTMKEPNETRRKLIGILAGVSDDYEGTLLKLEILISETKIQTIDDTMERISSVLKERRTVSDVLTDAFNKQSKQL